MNALKNSIQALVVAAAIASAPSALAGQVGTGATNTTSYEHGTVVRHSSGEAQGESFVRGRLYSTTMKQECTAEANATCNYGGYVTPGYAYGYQGGQAANADPVSITTITSEQSEFGRSTKSADRFSEVYKGFVQTTSHTAQSFGSF